MRKMLLSLCVAVPLALSATSSPQGFTDDLESALARAKASGKYVYACFSGSDWCGWCIKLEQEVFSDASFAPALSDDYELVFIDSPRDKSRLSESARARNPGLAKKYGICGLPTMIVFDGKDGSEVKRGSAYRAGGCAAYVEFLKGIRSGALQQDAAAKAEQAPAEVKAKIAGYAKALDGWIKANENK